LIINQRVRSKFPKSAFGKEFFGMRDQTASDSPPPEVRFDPNALEKCDGPRIAAVGVFSHRNFCETNSNAVSRFRDKTPNVSIAQQLIRHLGVLSKSLARPKGDPHFRPDRAVVRAHLSYGAFHIGHHTMPQLKSAIRLDGSKKHAS
jgi:hypothetical protein